MYRSCDECGQADEEVSRSELSDAYLCRECYETTASEVEIFTGLGPPVTEPLPKGAGRRNGRALPRRPANLLRELDTRQMLTTVPPPLEWLVDGVFARGHHTLFGGREKRGKSLVQLVFAVCMASGGGEVAGITVKPGRVLIIDAENGERMIHRRLRMVGLDPDHSATWWSRRRVPLSCVATSSWSPSWSASTRWTSSCSTASAPSGRATSATRARSPRRCSR